MENIFYFSQVFGVLNTILIIGFVLTTAVAVIALIAHTMNRCDDSMSEAETCMKWFKRSMIVAFLFALPMTFIPSKQTYLFMAGGKVVDDIVKNNPEVKDIPNNTLNLLNEYIKAETIKIRMANGDIVNETSTEDKTEENKQ